MAAPDDCVFCRIVDGTAAAEIVFSDDVAVGFLDRTPLFHGHTLVVPRSHAVELVDLDGAAVGPFFRRVQLLAAVLPTALDAQGTFVAMNNRVSQSVAHLHAHVVPRTRGDGLRGFFWPRTKYGEDEMALAGTRIRKALDAFDVDTYLSER